VLGLPSSPIQTIINTPLNGRTKYVSGSVLEVYSAAEFTLIISQPKRTPSSPGSASRARPRTVSRDLEDHPLSIFLSSCYDENCNIYTSQDLTNCCLRRHGCQLGALIGTSLRLGTTSWTDSNFSGSIDYTSPTTCAPDVGTCHYPNAWYSQVFLLKMWRASGSMLILLSAAKFRF